MQPNDPQQVPVVGDRTAVANLIQANESNSALATKLQQVETAFPEYRPVIGDGNCFYRWCACQVARNVNVALSPECLHTVFASTRRLALWVRTACRQAGKRYLQTWTAAWTAAYHQRMAHLIAALIQV